MVEVTFNNKELEGFYDKMSEMDKRLINVHQNLYYGVMKRMLIDFYKTTQCVSQKKYEFNSVNELVSYISSESYEEEYSPNEFNFS